MKITFTIFWTLISCFAFGQFAITFDKDGNCNVRGSSEKSNNVIDKLNNGHLVYVFETNGNWSNIDYTKNNKELNGQVYKDRLILTSSYQNVPMLTKNKLKAVLKKDSLQIVLTQQSFDRTKHKFTYDKEYKDQIELIDNKRYWGTDGGLPKTEYKSIEINNGKTKLTLPKSALTNLCEINLYNTQVYYDKTNDIIYIQSMNSDGAGGYEVIWKIEKGVYKEGYVAHGF
jgi:hypothetical protein